jgi:hypothetical protein
MTRAIRAAAYLFSSVVLSGCVGLAGLSYSGDGRLSDRGMLAYSSRYTIDLGVLDTSSPASRTYKLSGLPYATFTVGIEVIETEPNRSDDSKPKRQGRVAMELRNSAGALVIDESAPLPEWVRSYGLGATTSRFYRQGKSSETPLPGGGAQHTQTGVKASGGWGTYFNSEADDRYTLTVEIIEPFQPASISSRVTLVGWDRM